MCACGVADALRLAACALRKGAQAQPYSPQCFDFGLESEHLLIGNFVCINSRQGDYQKS